MSSSFSAPGTATSFTCSVPRCEGVTANCDCPSLGSDRGSTRGVDSALGGRVLRDKAQDARCVPVPIWVCTRLPSQSEARLARILPIRTLRGSLRNRGGPPAVLFFLHGSARRFHESPDEQAIGLHAEE